MTQQQGPRLQAWHPLELLSEVHATGYSKVVDDMLTLPSPVLCNVQVEGRQVLDHQVHQGSGHTSEPVALIRRRNLWRWCDSMSETRLQHGYLLHVKWCIVEAWQMDGTVGKYYCPLRFWRTPEGIHHLLADPHPPRHLPLPGRLPGVRACTCPEQAAGRRGLSAWRGQSHAGCPAQSAGCHGSGGAEKHHIKSLCVPCLVRAATACCLAR
jgi:hypothetical protein